MLKAVRALSWRWYIVSRSAMVAFDVWRLWNGAMVACLILIAEHEGPRLLLRYEETNSQFGGPDTGDVGKEM